MHLRLKNAAAVTGVSLLRNPSTNKERAMADAIRIESFDKWLDDETGPAALVLVEQLQPVTQGESVIFPPTYAPEQVSSSRKSEYVIDALRDGRNLCQIDSVGSQANRMEPIFKTEPYRALVPQVTVEVAENQKINLLDAGHRAADAIVRFSYLKVKLSGAFEAWLQGDASKLAEIAPTSLVFGVWDSRDTQAKAPRIVSSIIRAYDVELVTRSAQYVPAVEYTSEILGEAASLSDDQKSEHGLTHVPAPRALGGVMVRGEIRREATLNLVALRTMGVPDGKGGLDAAKTVILRRYILGLALTALTKPMAYNLRQGCLLVGIEGRPAEWKLVHFSGKRDAFDLPHGQALSFATLAARAFRDKFDAADQAGKFTPKLAKDAVEGKAAKKAAKKKKA
jgi:CRISPR-associated protein Csb1